MKKFFYWANYFSWLLLLLLIGGFASIMNGLSLEEYQQTLYPLLVNMGEQLSVSENYVAVRAVSSSFALVVIVVLICVIIANYLLKRNKYLIIAAGALFIAGGMCIIGAGNLLMIFTLYYWSSMGFCLFWRKNSSV